MRELSSVEHSWYLIGRHGPVNAARCYEVRGQLSEHQVNESLQALVSLSPALRCRIRPSETGARARFFEWHGPHTTVERIDGPTSPYRRREILESLLNTRIDPHQEPLLRFLWATDAHDHHWIFLCFHHSICDAITNLNCMRAFLSLCDAHVTFKGDLSSRREQLSHEMGHFPSLSSALTRRGLAHGSRQTLGYIGKKIKDEVKMQRDRLRGTKHLQFQFKGPRSSADLPQARIYHLTLPSSFATALRLAARAESLTVNAVFTASLLRSLKRHLFPRQSAATLNCITFVNLRSFVQPVPPEKSIGCYVSAAFTCHKVSDESLLQTLSREVSVQLDRARQSEVLEQARYADLVARGLLKMGRHTVATLSMSNIGDVSSLFDFNHFRVGEIHLHSSLSGLGAVLSVGLTATDHMLAFDLTYLEELISEENVRHIAADAVNELRTFVDANEKRFSPDSEHSTVLES